MTFIIRESNLLRYKNSKSYQTYDFILSTRYINTIYIYKWHIILGSEHFIYHIHQQFFSLYPCFSIFISFLPLIFFFFIPDLSPTYWNNMFTSCGGHISGFLIRTHIVNNIHSVKSKNILTCWKENCEFHKKIKNRQFRISVFVLCHVYEIIVHFAECQRPWRVPLWV